MQRAWQRPPGVYLGVALIVLATVSLAWRAVPAYRASAAVTETNPYAAGVPADLEQFLLAVKVLTPSSATIVTAGASSVTVYYRAAYLLYPRTVESAVVPSYDNPPPPVSWAQLAAAARRYGARYVLIWNQPVNVGGTILLRQNDDILAEVSP